MCLWHKTMFILTATALSVATAQADMTAMERAQKFGISDIRGIAYIPGPAGPEKPLDPRFGGVLPYFQGEIQTYDKSGNPYYQPDPNNPRAKLNVKYTIYYDSDFYNADFRDLWGKDVNKQGRDDLGRYKAELNANFIHLYDWNTDRRFRNHDPFLKYAKNLGMNVTIPISNYIYEIMCGSNPDVPQQDWPKYVKQLFDDIYEGSLNPDPAAGVLKIFNEFDVSQCKRADLVAQAALYWKELEDELAVPDRNRLPVIFPVTFGIKHDLAGGAVLDAFNAILAEPRLGLAFWKARVIYATNPFNDGPFMREWIDHQLPAWFMGHNIPVDTPVMFTEYGRSSDESNPPNEAGQAAWVKRQFQSMWQPAKPVNFLGACAFVNQYRFWLKAPEPNFALMDFNRGSGAWNQPVAMYVQTEKYQNPNAPLGQKWDASYQVDPQKPRPAYCEVARVYGASPSGDCP